MTVETRSIVSIHAPREGSDRRSDAAMSTAHAVSIHAPAGERHDCRRIVGNRGMFQSTLPARGATAAPWSSSAIDLSFNPRSRAGSDADPADHVACDNRFNPRSPRGERRTSRLARRYARSVSIHAPREGSDSIPARLATASSQFQSTLPARGATCSSCQHRRSR